MFLKKLFSIAALMFMTIAANAQMPNIPIDKDVRIGKLDNGLTYYIRYNNWPEKRANFYIAQRVGSIQEDITPYDGLDLETDNSVWAYPNVRSFSLGIDITF